MLPESSSRPGPCLPNCLITQLNPHLTQNPCNDLKHTCTYLRAIKLTLCIIWSCSGRPIHGQDWQRRGGQVRKVKVCPLPCSVSVCRPSPCFPLKWRAASFDGVLTHFGFLVFKKSSISWTCMWRYIPGFWVNEGQSYEQAVWQVRAEFNCRAALSS